MSVMSTRATVLASVLAATLLAACGGGDSTAPAAGNAGGNNNAQGAVPGCNVANFQAGTVEAPTSTQLTAYAATYNGDEGSFGPNPGDPFVKSASATLVFNADGTLTYKGVAHTVDSICVDKAAGPFGKLMYVGAGLGHFDIADAPQAGLGNAWGVSPADGTTIFQNGLKP